MSYAVSFKDAHYPGDVILHAIFLYLRYGVSYRDLEEIMAERGARVNHATLNRWVERYAGQVAEDARRRKQPADRSWRMDETYIKVKGRKIVIDKSAANTQGLKDINRMLKRFGCSIPIEMVRVKYFNNRVEQDHRFIKRRARPMLGFKSFTSAASTIGGIEIVNMIRKGQFRPKLLPFQQFC